MKNFTVVAMFGAIFLTALVLHLDGAAAVTETCFSCGPSGRCDDLPQSDCDKARRLIDVRTRYSTGGFKGVVGVCSGDCGMFVSGSNCTLRGADMIIAYGELRDSGCRKCGLKTYVDGCQFKIDHVTEC